MIRVGIVDDHAIVRSGLRQFFADLPDLTVVGEAASGREAIDLVRAVPMDVLILDISMPRQTGLDALGMIRVKAPAVGVLVLSGYAEEHYAAKLVRHGVRGYLNKACDPTEIVDAIRAIAQGRRYFSPMTSELLLDQIERKRGLAPHERLTDREFQVFLRLARGETTAEIADTLSLSLKTVSAYRGRLLERMGLATNSDLTYYAVKCHLID